MTEAATEAPRGIPALFERIMRTRPVRVMLHYSESGGPLFASGLAFQALFAIFAALFVFFAVFGFVLRDNAALRDSLLQLLTSSVPGLIGDKNSLVSIDTLLDSTILGWTGVIAAAGLLWTALNFLGSLRQAVRILFSLPGPTVLFVLLKLKDAGLALVFGAVLIVSAALSVFSTSFVDVAFDVLGIGSDSTLGRVTGTVVGLLIMLALDTATLAGSFRILSGIPIPWKNLWVGALMGGIALGALKVLGTQLLGGASRNPLLASFAVLIGLLIWFNLVCQVILIVASWISVGMSDAGISARKRTPDEIEREREEQLRLARRTLAEAERERLRAALPDASLLKRRRLEKQLSRLEDELADAAA
ncbi:MULTISPECIES: YihY/virulence factor BrkB family protein [unclassified Rathayibacter]|uniref:YihY/virulence factor BrkB family protein n=1 Tax=unclassified Rathayibacter TaxID=2609250 RepID=UPI000F4B9C1C|nr:MULTISPECIES: YihY/virulence factor BrkB family protein [unclassified Rathayibacter]ROP57510.1 membrane protein [Rathayibacter sp. PhB186]ROS55895.1 membrane protein [Rathayibacter sp. PhB185]TCL84639.1 membrane protein [Rathayibacter sp. PhB192]TCM30357.1 membrane protein [Rathayibacter sp. PhB179]